MINGTVAALLSDSLLSDSVHDMVPNLGTCGCPVRLRTQWFEGRSERMSSTTTTSRGAGRGQEPPSGALGGRAGPEPLRLRHYHPRLRYIACLLIQSTLLTF